MNFKRKIKDNILKINGGEPRSLDELVSCVIKVINTVTPVKGFAWDIRKGEVSNSHDCPMDGVTNWSRSDTSLPTSYPGWCGRVWIRYDSYTKDRGHFVGLPVPAAGLLIAVLPLLMLYNPFDVQLVIINRWFLYALIGAISWLMVSTLPLLNLKFKNYSFTDNKARYILLALAIPFILILGWLAVPTIFITYILVSLLFKNQLT